jgi:S1-C subfamily serine protease
MNEYKKERQEDSEGVSGAICPKEERQEVIFLYEREQSENAPERKNKPLWTVLVSLLALIVAGAAVYLLAAMKKAEPQTPTESTEALYSGIFESAEAARRSIASSVSLRLGVADELGGDSVSGVIVSNDGWILSGAPAFKGERGRIYVRLHNGKDIPVEEVRYDGEGRLTLYRISAEELVWARLAESSSLPQGEELIAVSSCGAPDYACALVSGVMSHPSRSVRIEQDGDILRFDGLMQVDLSLGEDGCGAPLFDKKGNLVGVSLSGAFNYFTGVEKISSFLSKIN